jgi:uncharacterized protein with beta-barrel porin domain
METPLMLTTRRIGPRLSSLTAAALFAVCLAWTGAAEAAVIVTETTDNGQGNVVGSLSYYINRINNGMDTGPITFNLNGSATTLNLTGSMIGISSAGLVINGGGVTINGNGFQVFTVNAAASADFQNMAINGGRAQGQVGGNGNGGGGGGLGGGGAIYVDPLAGAIGIQNVTFTNNQAVGGAGGTGNSAVTNGGTGGTYNFNAGPNTSPGGPTGVGGGVGGQPAVDAGNGVGNGGDGGYGGGGGGGTATSTEETNLVDPLNGDRAVGNGGGSGGLTGQGGNGGLALGGAVFIGNNNTTTIRGGTTIAANNSAIGGAGGTGTSANGTAGNGNGGGLYVGVFSNANFESTLGNITVAGNIFSNGDLNIAGPNVVSFLGVTIVSTASNAGANTNIAAGGTLNTTTLGVMGAVTNDGTLRFTQGGLGAFNGQLSGTGDVEIEGNGTVVFDAPSTFTYTGDTRINNGVLFLGTTSASSDTFIGANAGMIGDGTLAGNLTNSGFLAPGDGIGTLAVGGNFTSNVNSTTQIQINSAGNTPGVNNDLIAVAGNANILGGDIFVQLSGGVFTTGTPYTFLTYGTLSGPGFEDVTTNSAFLSAEVDDTVPGQLRLILTRNPTTYASVADTFNQSQVGGYLDANSAGATGDFANVLDNINTLDPTAARFAYDDLSGSIYGTSARAAVQQTSMMYLMLRRGSRGNEEIGAVRADSRIVDEDSFGDEDIRLVSFTSEEDRRANIMPVLRVRRERRYTWNAWSTTYGSLSNNLDDRVNGLGGRYGSWGQLTSIYRYIDDGLKFGVFGAYNQQNLRLKTPFQSNNSHDFQTGSYLRGDDGTSYFLAASSVGYDSYESTRTIEFANISRQAFGNYDGMQTTGYLEVGRKTPFWPADLEPFVAVQYTYLHQNSFVETNAGAIGLNVNGADTNSFRTLLGSRIAFDLITLAGEPLKNEFHVAWMHENLGANTTIAATFVGVGGAAFGAEGVNLGRDWAVLGVGFSWAPSENTSLAANYDALLNENTSFHLASGSFQYRW